MFIYYTFLHLYKLLSLLLLLLIMLTVAVAGLERVAEELMGRRKWKLYQDVLTRSTQNSTVNAAAADALDSGINLAVNNISTGALYIL